MNEEFDQSKLAQYVIDMIFWMHGFNINYETSPQNLPIIVSPVVVINVIETLSTNLKQTFIQWDDYIKFATHSRLQTLFCSKRYVIQKILVAKIINKLLITEKIKVNKNSVKPYSDSIYDLTPQSILFQEGYLTVSKLCKVDSFDQVVLRVPNYGVKMELVSLRAGIKGTRADFITGLFDQHLQFRKRVDLIYKLFKKYQRKAYRIFNKTYPTLQQKSQTNYTMMQAKYLQNLLIHAQDEIQVIYKKEHESKKGDNILCPSLTVKFKDAKKMAAIQVYSGYSNQRMQAKVEKYRQLNPEKFGTVIIIGYDKNFKKIVDFSMYESGEGTKLHIR